MTRPPAMRTIGAIADGVTEAHLTERNAEEVLAYIELLEQTNHGLLSENLELESQVAALILKQDCSIQGQG